MKAWVSGAPLRRKGQMKLTFCATFLTVPACLKGVSAMVRNWALPETRVQEPSRRKDLYLVFLEASIFVVQMAQSIQAILYITTTWEAN